MKKTLLCLLFICFISNCLLNVATVDAKNKKQSVHIKDLNNIYDSLLVASIGFISDNIIQKSNKIVSVNQQGIYLSSEGYYNYFLIATTQNKSEVGMGIQFLTKGKIGGDFNFIMCVGNGNCSGSACKYNNNENKHLCSCKDKIGAGDCSLVIYDGHTEFGHYINTGLEFFESIVQIAPLETK